MKKYTINPFAKTYNEKGELGYWATCGKVEVEADSLEEAITLATKQVYESYQQKGIKIGDFLVDSALEENGNHLQMMAWDESGFPAF